MKGYWIRHRLLPTIILCIVSAMVVGLLFAFPHITQQAISYNVQSIYKNSDVDFIAPEPSFKQVSELAGTNGISNIFPFYLTKTAVTINGTSRMSTVLLSDQFQNVDFTMYNSARLIKKADTKVNNPILIDWQFAQDTGAKIGDTVSFTINGATVKFQVYAIYETNTIYDGGAILAQITAEQADGIRSKSTGRGYSGMYISASDYNACRMYLTTDYRPLGRLKARESFNSDEQYKIHYDAVMSSGYANEITDFHIRESDSDVASSTTVIWLGAILTAGLAIAFNVLMKMRGCEKAYFTKFCIPKGQNVKLYYKISFAVETIMWLVIFAGVLFGAVYSSDAFIPYSAIDIRIVVIPAAMVVAEIASIIMNNTMVADIAKEAAQTKNLEQ